MQDNRLTIPHCQKGLDIDTEEERNRFAMVLGSNIQEDKIAK